MFCTHDCLHPDLIPLCVDNKGEPQIGSLITNHLCLYKKEMLRSLFGVQIRSIFASYLSFLPFADVLCT